MQVECQVAARKAQAFAAFCNAENALLSSKQELFAELGRVANGVFTNRQVNAGRCWVNVPVHERAGRDTRTGVLRRLAFRPSSVIVPVPSDGRDHRAGTDL